MTCCKLLLHILFSPWFYRQLFLLLTVVRYTVYNDYWFRWEVSKKLLSKILFIESTYISLWASAVFFLHRNISFAYSTNSFLFPACTNAKHGPCSVDDFNLCPCIASYVQSNFICIVTVYYWTTDYRVKGCHCIWNEHKSWKGAVV
jgi:hypothetical protein